jgi:hypothetical protein
MKNFKFKIPVSAVFCVLTGFSFGQDFYESTGDSIVAIVPLEGSVTMNLTQTHTGNDTLNFIFEKLSVQMPPDWSANICDNSACNPTLIESALMSPVFAGDNGFLIVHCATHSNYGTAIVRYTLREVNGLYPTDTLTWIVTSAYAGITSQIEQSIYCIQNNILFLKEQSKDFTEMSLIDLQGKVIKRTRIKSDLFVNLNEYTSGIYFIQIEGSSSTFRQKITIQ